MKKNILFIYLALEAFILLMAWITFSNLGDLSASFAETQPLPQITAALNSLYVAQAIFAVTLFLVIAGLIVRETIRLRKQRVAKELAENEFVAEVLVDESEDTEEIEREKEKIAREEALGREKKFYEYLDKETASSKAGDTKQASEKILSSLGKVYEITQAEIFLRNQNEVDGTDRLVLSATFAFYIPDEKVFEFQMGEGLIGQVAKAGEHLYLDELPEGYITVKSGLGSATPNHLLIAPWKDKEGKTFAIIEIASFKPFHAADIEVISNISEKVQPYFQ